MLKNMQWTCLTCRVAVDDKESRIAANQAATPGQAQAMLKSNAKDREKEQVELMELERSAPEVLMNEV